MANVEEKGLENGGLLDYTQDGTTDLISKVDITVTSFTMQTQYRSAKKTLAYNIFLNPIVLHHGFACNFRLVSLIYSISCRFLDRAAVKSTKPSTPWTLCPVTQVEETKQMKKMIPLLLTTFIPSITIAQAHTLFIKQGTTLDTSMGPHFKIPPASILAFVMIFMLVSLAIYDRCLVPMLRCYTQNPRGMTLLNRMGIGFFVQILIMVVACLVEKKRLLVARDPGIVGKGEKVPLTIFILLPQFALMGVADAFVEVAKIEFFYDQAPQGMKSMGTSYYTSSYAMGSFLSSFLLRTVSEVTKRDGHKGWVLDNLNVSYLDNYYICTVGWSGIS